MKDTYLLDNYSINFKGNLISLSRPVVMSILNTTPDSFFDGGKYNSIDKALKKVEKDLKQGATIIDIGGYSTKPGANSVTIDEEIRRTIPYIEKIVELNLTEEEENSFKRSIKAVSELFKAAQNIDPNLK